MAPRSSSPDDREPFKALCEDLSKALGKKGVAKVPKSTAEKMSQFVKENRENEGIFEEEVIGELVSVLEGDSSSSDESTSQGSEGTQNLPSLAAIPPNVKSCARIDASTWVIVLQTLLLAERCRSAERGVYLLAASLHHKNITSQSPQSTEVLSRKKAAIGSGAFQQLLNCFVTSDEEDHMRVWAGLILILLLENCEENAYRMSTAPEDTRRMLGPLVINQNDEIIRIVGAKILKASRKAQLDMSDFWPVDQDPILYSEFPLSQPNLAWNRDFQNWADGQNSVKEADRVLHFAYVLRTTPAILEASGKDSDISILFSEDEQDYELSIYVQARGVFFDQRLDVPLSLISKITTEETPMADFTDDARVRPFDLVISVSGSIDEQACFLNAKSCTEHQIREIRVTAEDEDTAKFLVYDIEERRTDLRKRNVQTKVRPVTHPSQESNKSSWSHISQSAEPLYLTAKDSGQPEDDESEIAPEDEALPPAAAGIGNQVAEESQANRGNSMRVSNHAAKGPGSLNKEMAQNPVARTHSRQSPSNLAGPALAVLHDLAVDDAEDEDANEHMDSNRDKSPGTASHKQKQPLNSSRDQERIGLDSNTQKAESKSGREIPAKKTAGQMVKAVVSTSSQEDGSQPERGRPRKKLTKEAESLRDDSPGKESIAKTNSSPSRGPRPKTQIVARGHSPSRGASGGNREQPRIPIADHAKGKEKLVDNSGISTDKSRSRTVQSPDFHLNSSSGITSPEPHDASTPKIARNATLRNGNDHLAKRGPVTAKIKTLSKEVGSNSVEPEPSAAAKKLPLKAKPSIIIPKRSQRPVGKGKQNSTADHGHKNTDADLSNQSGGQSAPTKAQAKAAQKSSNRSTIQTEKEPTVEKESQDDMWNLPPDAEDVPKEPRGKGQAVSNTAKRESKSSAASRKVIAQNVDVKPTKERKTLKNAVKKKTQPAPRVPDIAAAKAPPRSKRQAAVTAASRISQLSSDNEREDEDIEDLEPSNEAAVDEDPMPTTKSKVSITSKKSAPAPKIAPARGAAEKAAALQTKSSNIMEGSGARDKQVIREVPEGPQENTAEPLDAVFQQLQEDAIQLNLSQEQFDAVEHNLDVASPIPQIRKGSPKKQRRSVAAALESVIEEIELVKRIPTEDLAQERDAASDTRQSPNDISPETTRVLRGRKSTSPLEFSSSVQVHSAHNSPKNRANDQQLRGTPQQELVGLMSAPRVDKKRNVIETDSSPSVRRRLGLQPMDPPVALNMPNSPKKRAQKVTPNAVKKSTPPQRRSPAQRNRASEASVVDLHQVIRQDTILLDDRLARKTPLIAFGKTGPKNQGVSSSKKVSAQPPSLLFSVEATKSQDELQNFEPTSGLRHKLKRGNELGPGDEDLRQHKRIRSFQEPQGIRTMKGEKARPETHSYVESRSSAKKPILNESDLEANNEVGNNYYDPGTPDSPPSQEPAIPLTFEEPNLPDLEPYDPHQQNIDDAPPPLPVQEHSQSQKTASQVSKVDENGSPVGSREQTVGYRKLISGLVNNMTIGSFLPKKQTESPSRFEILSSNAKAKPMAPGMEQRRYVAHRETGDDQYEDIASKAVVHSKRQIEDPFADKQPQRKLSGFTERLEASRTNLIEKRLPAVKAMQRSKSENYRYQPTKDAELVREAAPNPGVPVKVTHSVPELQKLAADSESLKARVEEIEKRALNDKPKRKASFQLEKGQPDADGQQKRRKPSSEVQELDVDSGNKECQRRLQQQAPKLSQPVDESIGDKANTRPRKSPPKVENLQPDTGVLETMRRPFVAIESRRTRRAAPEQPEKPAVANKKSYQQRMQEKPAHYPTRRSHRVFEDPEKTLVEEQSSPPSEVTTVSSDLTNRTESSPVSPELPSPEEEWGVELRRHERPILENLYRIANDLVSHLVGQREAVEDIVDDYLAGGTDLIEMLESDHNAEKDRVLAGFEASKARLSMSYVAAQRAIAQGSKEARASSISSLEKEWNEQDEDLQSFIAERIEGE